LHAAVQLGHSARLAGLRRTRVGSIGDAVAVIVRVRAAVVVLEAIDVLRLVRALVSVRRDSIVIGVRIGAARARGVLRPCFVRARISGVEDAVAIVVGIDAAVVVLELVHVLLLFGTLVRFVRNAVVVVVEVGAAVAIFESVLVFGKLGALI